MLDIKREQSTDSTSTKAHQIAKEGSFARPTNCLETGFPFAEISDIAEVESWRKEVYRPVYHMHKWWAQRLGSVFRALALGATTKSEQELLERFYSKPQKKSSFTVFDPFMGSGTTVGEALKLGFRAIGRDINPVAYFSARAAFSEINESKLVEEFKALEISAGEKIRKLYRGRDSDGNECDVLYFFWVKVVPCPKCTYEVDLFSSYIFSKNAYPKKHPKAQTVCPKCSRVAETRYDSTNEICQDCGHQYNPQVGPARHQNAVCNSCAHEFSIAKTVKERGAPPKHRMYAKMVLDGAGQKKYLSIDQLDLRQFDAAKLMLASFKNSRPESSIEPGHNTNQARNYCYEKWHQMFNDRQLLAINILGSEIVKINDIGIRDALFCLFSGALEFNNMFASFKGEGTGAVRHMFSHHILKPERTPLEANLWGTPKSSGAFSTLFKSRLLRAIEYKNDPFEIECRKVNGEISVEKRFGINFPIAFESSNNFRDFENDRRQLYLSCGTSAKTDIADGAVDLVLTDPPFFDNVHYSELADFFFAWQRHFNVNNVSSRDTTRNDGEVQQKDPVAFSKLLSGVFVECNRVLKNEGLLVFSYHHSREEGWTSVAEAVWNAGFVFTGAFPVKAEMASAAPKSAAKEPIDLDIILVCRKKTFMKSSISFDGDFLSAAIAQVGKLRQSGRKLSRNDCRIIAMGQALVFASKEPSAKEYLRVAMSLVEEKAEEIWIASGMGEK